MLGDYQFCQNGKRRQNCLRGTTSISVKRGRVTLQKYGFCIGIYMGKQMLLLIQFQNQALTVF